MWLPHAGGCDAIVHLLRRQGANLLNLRLLRHGRGFLGGGVLLRERIVEAVMILVVLAMGRMVSARLDPSTLPVFRSTTIAARA